jgi:hypothetical protein
MDWVFWFPWLIHLDPFFWRGVPRSGMRCTTAVQLHDSRQQQGSAESGSIRQALAAAQSSVQCGTPFVHTQRLWHHRSGRCDDGLPNRVRQFGMQCPPGRFHNDPIDSVMLAEMGAPISRVD